MSVSVVSFSFSMVAKPSTGFPYYISPTPLTQLTCLPWLVEPNWPELNCPLFNSSAFKLRRGDMDTPPQLLPISSDRDASLPLSLEWPVWSSSSGNNCHAVHRSLSSGASLWSGTFTLSHIISRAHLRDFFRLLAIGMCHFLPVHHLGMAFLAGSKVKIQQNRQLLLYA